jgi:hypothetical protein
MFIITKETAEAYLKGRATQPPTVPVAPPSDSTGNLLPPVAPPAISQPPLVPASPTGLTWTGEIPPQKWMNFYTKVLSKFAAAKGLKLKLTVEVAPESGISKQKVEETKAALRELGMNDDINSI